MQSNNILPDVTLSEINGPDWIKVQVGLDLNTGLDLRNLAIL